MLFSESFHLLGSQGPHLEMADAVSWVVVIRNFAEFFTGSVSLNPPFSPGSGRSYSCFPNEETEAQSSDFPPATLLESGKARIQTEVFPLPNFGVLLVTGPSTPV